MVDGCGCGFILTTVHYRFAFSALSVLCPLSMAKWHIRKPTLLRLHVQQNNRKYNYETFSLTLSSAHLTLCTSTCLMFSVFLAGRLAGSKLFILDH